MNTRIKSGFTLIELALVLVIISALIGMILFNIQVRMDASRTYVTKERLQMISEAIDRYVEVYGRLPCPRASRSIRLSTNYGLADQSRCDAAATSAVLKGDVPYRTLGLDAQTIADGWGIRFDYAIPAGYAVGTNLTTDTEKNYIVVRNIGGGSGDASIAYVVLSHGPNTLGGYIDKTASYIDPANGTDLDKENSNADKYYIQTLPNRDADDFLLYRTTWSLPLYINGTRTGGSGVGGLEAPDL